MKTIFDIGQETEAKDGQTLLLEIGPDHCCMATLHSQTNSISRIRLFALSEMEAERQLPELSGLLRNETYESVVVSSAYPQALLYPYKIFNNDHTAIDLVYDQPAQDYFHDRILEWQMVALYSMPQIVTTSINPLSSNTRYFHSYTPAIKIYNGYVADHQLTVHFTAKHFRVLLKKDMAICLAQTYTYKTPLDVVYYLLKICYEFGLSQQEVYLIISGFVEQDSALFSELHQFFTHVYFAQPPGLTLPPSDYPHYYFTSISNLAACVL